MRGQIGASWRASGDTGALHVGPKVKLRVSVLYVGVNDDDRTMGWGRAEERRSSTACGHAGGTLATPTGRARTDATRSRGAHRHRSPCPSTPGARVCQPVAGGPRQRSPRVRDPAAPPLEEEGLAPPPEDRIPSGIPRRQRAEAEVEGAYALEERRHARLGSAIGVPVTVGGDDPACPARDQGGDVVGGE